MAGGINISSLKVLDQVNNIEIGSSNVKEIVPLLTIKQNNTFEVKIQNTSSVNKYGTLGVFMNGRFKGSAQVRIPQNSTEAITLDLSVPGPGIHTLKITVMGDSGGKFNAEISKKFYWCAIKEKAAKFTVDLPSNKVFTRGDKAPFKVEVFNIGTERIKEIPLKAMAGNKVIINRTLKLPSYIPPGGTVKFTANYTAHTAGVHVVKFELDPAEVKFNRDKLMNAIGEDFIEIVQAKWLPKIGDRTVIQSPKITIDELQKNIDFNQDEMKVHTFTKSLIANILFDAANKTLKSSVYSGLGTAIGYSYSSWTAALELSTNHMEKLLKSMKDGDYSSYCFETEMIYRNGPNSQLSTNWYPVGAVKITYIK